MKQRQSTSGFSHVELLAVIAILFILAVFMLKPGLYKTSGPAHRIKCISHLKNVGLAFRIFATDNNDLFPAPALSNHAAVARLDASTHFAFLTNELSTPKILHCPQDTARTPAKDFTTFSTLNISYFSSLSADETKPELWLAGDRNLIINGQPARAGQQLTVLTNDQVAWTREIHNEQGNVAMADGSVQQFTIERLNHSLQTSLNTNLLLFP